MNAACLSVCIKDAVLEAPGARIALWASYSRVTAMLDFAGDGYYREGPPADAQDLELLAHQAGS
jgi:hypothetical protein